MAERVLPGEEDYDALVALWEANGRCRAVSLNGWVYEVYTDPHPYFVRLPKKASLKDSYYGPYAVEAPDM